MQLTDKRFVTLPEYLENAKDTNENTVYYATDRSLQSQYISLLNANGIDVALMEHVVDTQFAAMLEDFDGKVKYLRVDADVANAIKLDESVDESEKLAELFKKASKNDRLSVSFSALKDESIPALLNVSEESRRMEEMMKLYASRLPDMDGSYPTEMSLIINTRSPLIEKLEDLAESEPNKAEMMASYIYKLSLLSQKKFSADEMNGFLADGFALLSLL